MPCYIDFSSAISELTAGVAGTLLTAAFGLFINCFGKSLKREAVVLDFDTGIGDIEPLGLDLTLTCFTSSGAVIWLLKTYEFCSSNETLFSKSTS